MTPAEKRSVIKIHGKAKRVDGSEAEGAPSYMMTLPKYWCREHNWPESVYVSRQPDGSLKVEAVRE